MRSRFGRISLTSLVKLATCVALAACVAFPQSDRGALTGNVTDQDGVAVPEVLVQAKNSSSNTIYKATSSASGDYKFEGLPAGSYEISIPVFGFLSAQQSVTLSAGQTLRLDLRVRDNSLNTPGEDRSFFAARNSTHPTPKGPAPRTREAKPDLSGVWWPPRIVEPIEPALLPRAAAIVREWVASNAKDLPSARCLPNGVTLLGVVSLNKLVQTPALLLNIREVDAGAVRQVFLDGRGHPKDLDPAWMGHSIGSWEGDTLVVDTIGFNDKSWITDTLPALFPHTEMLHLTTRFRRPDLGHLEMDVTFDDPGSFAKPWTMKTVSDLAQGEEVQEWICNENNQDAEHLVGK